MSKYDLDNGYIIEVESGEELFSIEEIDKADNEIVKKVIIDLLEEIVTVEDEMLDKDHRIQTLEEDLEMFEDNFGIEE